MSKNPRPGPRLIQGIVAVVQKRSCQLRLRVDEYRQHIHFRIPEIMPLIPLSGQPFGSHAGPSVPSRSLHNVEQVEADSLEQLFIPIHLHIRGRPEGIHIFPLALPLPRNSKGRSLRQYLFHAGGKLSLWHVKAGCIAHILFKRHTVPGLRIKLQDDVRVELILMVTYRQRRNQTGIRFLRTF